MLMSSNNMSRGSRTKIEKRWTWSSLDCLMHSGLLKRDKLTDMYMHLKHPWSFAYAWKRLFKWNYSISSLSLDMQCSTLAVCLLTERYERENLFSSCPFSNCHFLLLSIEVDNLGETAGKKNSELKTEGTFRTGAMINLKQRWRERAVQHASLHSLSYSPPEYCYPSHEVRLTLFSSYNF